MIPRKQLTVPWVPVRQTVLSGSVDGAGFPNALSAGSGLAVTLTATGTPFTVAFAAGFDARGAIDYVVQSTTNQTFASLTASSTCFLYLDRDSNTGALTTNFSTLVPVYSGAAPASPATGQHWFDLSTFTMKRWSGSAWIVFQRVFVGEAVTGTSTITSVDTYAYRGLYMTAWFAVTVNSNYSKKHYLGMSLAAAMARITVFSSTSATGASNVTSLAPPISSLYLMLANNTYGYSTNAGLIDSRLGYGIQTGGAGVHYDGSAWQTSAYYAFFLQRGW